MAAEAEAEAEAEAAATAELVQPNGEAAADLDASIAAVATELGAGDTAPQAVDSAEILATELGAQVSPGESATSPGAAGTVAKVYTLITGVRPTFGEGREPLPGGGYYEGGFRHGKRDGKGVLSCNAQGTEVYEGVFELEFMHGLGRKTWPDGSVYQGAWQKGRKHGHGVLEEPSGRRYEGQWHDGKRHGIGTQRLDANSQYEGRWENGLQHGTGKYTDVKDASVYEGKWHCGAHHGAGLLRRKDGGREKLRYCHGMLELQEVLPLPTEYMPVKKMK